MQFEGKKILILAGAGTHVKVVKAAKELGLYTIVTDYLKNSPAKKIADESWMYSITDVDEIVTKCKEVGIDGVLNFCIDPAQKPYYEICTRLGLPCYATKKQIDVLTDKIRFKEYCRAHNVDVIPDYSEDDILGDCVEYPIFIKPTDSRGSRGQCVCYDKEHALIAVEEAKAESSDGRFLCEKYLGHNQDLATAWFVVDGEPYLVKLGDRHLGRKEDNLDKQVMCTMQPSEYTSLFENNVYSRVKQMIKDLGVKFGPVFMQGFADGNTIRFYDPAIRMPGGDYDLILKQATGFDTVKSAVHFAMTGDCKTVFGNPENCYKMNGGTGFMISVSVRPGKIFNEVGLDEIAREPNIVYVREIIPAGSVIPNSGDIKQRVAAIGVYVSDKDQIQPMIDMIYSKYHVYDENGEDMIISRYTYHSKNSKSKGTNHGQQN